MSVTLDKLICQAKRKISNSSWEKMLFYIYKNSKCLCFISLKLIFLGFKVLKRILRLYLTKKLIIFFLISSYGISHLFWFTVKATGRSGMYLPREVLNFVRHVDFLKYYYFKFCMWRKKGTKVSKLEMAECSKTNGVRKKILQKVLALLTSKVSCGFFCTFLPPLKLPEMTALALLLLAEAS